MPEPAANYWSSVAGEMASPNATNPHHDQEVAELNNALEARLLVSMIRKHFPEGGRLLTLDIGAGMGRFSELAAGFGRVHALEPSGLAETLSTRFRNFPEVAIIRETFDRFSPRDRYDLIIVSGVLTEIEDRQAREFVGKAAANLRPGGLFFLRDYVSPSVTKTHGDARYRHYARPLPFWRGLLASAGLEMQFWRYSHNPYLLFQLSERLRLLKPIVHWLYSPCFYPAHRALNAALSPLWNPVLRLLNRDRMALFFAWSRQVTAKH